MKQQDCGLPRLGQDGSQCYCRAVPCGPPFSLNITSYRMATSRLYVSDDLLARAEKDTFSMYVSLGFIPIEVEMMTTRMCSAFARIENHFFMKEVRLVCLALLYYISYSSPPHPRPMLICDF